MREGEKGEEVARNLLESVGELDLRDCIYDGYSEVISTQPVEDSFSIMYSVF